ncbi:hypothetical protein B4U79_19066, partial [Dinothrombium tinctorium]
EKTDITLQDKEGNTAMMYAVKLGSAAILRTFIDNFIAFGVDPNVLRQRNIYGKTALEMAKEAGKSECVLILTNFVTHNFELPHEWRTINTTESKSTLDSESSPVKPASEQRPLTRRSKPITEKRKETILDEKQIKRKNDAFKTQKKLNHNKADAFHEIWEKETMNWFNGAVESDNAAVGQFTKASKESENSPEKSEEFKLPPINGNKLIDYKTWCDMGESTGRRGSNFIIQNPS